MPHGFLLIDKVSGPTSHDVIDALRRITGERRIGHAGTLDPFASGLLLVAVGRESTRELSHFVGLDKEYEATIVLGVRSTTLDTEGELESVPLPNLSIERLAEAMKSLTGEIEQIPPMHSAIKVGGKKLYEMARKGEEIERKPRDIRVETFESMGPIGLTNLGPTGPTSVQARIVCSSGTYVRALARDLGEALGTSAYLSELRRTRIGAFCVSDAIRVENLTKENWSNHLKDLSKYIDEIPTSC